MVAAVPPSTSPTGSTSSLESSSSMHVDVPTTTTVEPNLALRRYKGEWADKRFPRAAAG